MKVSGRERQPHRATAHSEVASASTRTVDQVPGGPALAEVELTERFSGEVAGEGTARVVQATQQDGTAIFAGIERVRGSIAGHAGTFLLQVSGTVVAEDMQAEWFVVPGSGTGDLAGLRGDGGFEARLGRHGSIWLDYYFD